MRRAHMASTASAHIVPLMLSGKRCRQSLSKGRALLGSAKEQRRRKHIDMTIV